MEGIVRLVGINKGLTQIISKHPCIILRSCLCSGVLASGLSGVFVLLIVIDYGMRIISLFLHLIYIFEELKYC